MKKFLAGIALLLAACGSGHKHMVIREEFPGKKLRIEYRGDVVFNAAGSAIRSMQPGASVHYELNGASFLAKADREGHILYACNGKQPAAVLRGREKLFMQRAIADMVRLRGSKGVK
ncbi:hypothetical protein [Pedobacter yulinensis]|nr:hypothetical protein [Pedobacter yulinensis]